jgi:hypothetical protein
VVAFWSVDVFLTSARIRCTGGAEKVGPSAEKYFFDSIDPLRTSTVHRSIRDKLAFTGGEDRSRATAAMSSRERRTLHWPWRFPN